MVTKNNDYVTEGTNNDQMKYSLYADTRSALHTHERWTADDFDRGQTCRKTSAQPPLLFGQMG